ncbi:MAG: hypothetical protein EXS17_04630 [Phycisphaerales bacterium]|nr:hypothetical protein [Phycisphaerales bacterium]
MVRKVVIAGSVLVAACVVATALFLDAAAARILTSAASHVLGTPTTVRSARLGIFDRKSSVTGLQIAQPTGFGEGPMISVASASITVGLIELCGDDIVIEAIEIDGVDVNLVEVNGQVNVQVVANTVAHCDDAPPPPPTPPSTAKGASGSVTIRSLRVTNIRVSARGNAALADGQSMNVTIPDIVANDLGTKTPASEIAAKVTTELMDRLLVAIVQAKIEGLPNEVLSGLQSASSTLSDVTQSILR